MHRIDTAGSTVDNKFTDGDPQTATQATVVDDDFMNTVQEELAHVIEQAGIVLSKPDQTQLYQAIMVLIANAIPDVPDASTTVKGKIEIATNTETTTGTDAVRAVTPAGVKAAIDDRVASMVMAGLVELATDAEAVAKADATRALTPANLAALAATTVLAGLAERATDAEAAAETDTVRFVTPKHLGDFRATLQSSFDIGDIKPTFRSTEPTNWMFADGRSLLRADYPTLFDEIGTTHGAADGTHFNLPDMRGRVPVGRDNMGGTTAGRVTNALCGIIGTALGAVGGLQSFFLSVAQMPQHNHIQGDGWNSGVLGAVAFGTTNNVNTRSSGYGSAPIVAEHPLTSNTGGGDRTIVMQPSIICNWLIKVS